jgi:predicted ABC-type transport system involved in lysophospholipase L1 biosynthesis ATPase subunit
MVLLALRDVSKRLADGVRGVLVLDGVSFEVGEGEVVGLLGLQRAGKTSLLRIVAGLDVPDSGVVCWEGHDLAEMSADERARFRRLDGIALARGDWSVGEAIPVVEYIARSICGNGLRMGEADGLARRALEEAKVSDLGRRAVSQLGVRERLYVGLAHALAHRPRLLLVDEPAVLRGMNESEEFYALLHAVCRRRGSALLIASEDMAPLAGVTRLLHLANHKIHTESDRQHNVVPIRGGNGTQAA